MIALSEAFEAKRLIDEVHLQGYPDDYSRVQENMCEVQAGADQGSDEIRGTADQSGLGRLRYVSFAVGRHYRFWWS